MRGRVVAVEGPSAAGKTRAVGTVARHLGGAPLAEAFERLTPHPSLEWVDPEELLRLEQTLLAEDARRYREARDLAEAEGIVVVDTGFLGALTYTWGLVRTGAASRPLLQTLVRSARDLARRGEWGLPDAVLYLATPEPERDRRARRDPVGHPVELRDRHRRIAAEERRFYRAVLAPSYGSRFRSVSGRGTPAEVAGRLARAGRLLAASHEGPPPVAPVLRALGDPAGVP